MWDCDSSVTYITQIDHTGASKYKMQTSSITKVEND